MSCCRAHHTVVLYNNMLYHFGGAGANNQIEVYDPIFDTWWVQPYFGGNPPTGRYGHAASLLNDRMYIFGGIDATTNEVLGDLYYFNFNDFSWNEVSSSKWNPLPRTGAKLVTYREHLFLLGGTDNDNHENKFFNDLWTFHEEDGWVHVTPRGELLPGRAYFAAGVYNDQLMVFGGITTKTYNQYEYLNDMWFINVKGFFPQYNYEREESFYVPPKWNTHAMLSQFAWPPARADFAYSFQRTELTIFAGSDEDRETRADIWSTNFGYEEEEYTVWWGQRACYPGYEFPWCILNCR